MLLGIGQSFGQKLSKPKNPKTENKDTVATRQWVREYIESRLNPHAPVVVSKLDCKTGLDLLTAKYSDGRIEFSFQAVDVRSIDWTLTQSGAFVSGGNTGQLTSSQVSIQQKLTAGAYELQIRATNCNSDPAKGKRAFDVSNAALLPNSDRHTGGHNLFALKDPFLPSAELAGEYELRYIESRPDEHLDLRISQLNGQLLLSDIGNSLQSASYTLNGWTDLENCGKLENEPILPYRLYHVSKYSISQSSIREVWRAMYDNPKAEFRRSELFFYVVPKSETWNPAGDSPNPIGRPSAFSKLPAFSLKNRSYGFEYEFLDETDERKKQLGIQFNWQKGKRHLKLYAHSLSSYLLSLPSRKGFHDLTEQECIDFANGLPIEQIVAFDIEPHASETWIVDYAAPNFTRNMGYVIERLKQRGALAYNWLCLPTESPNNLTLDGVMLGPYLRYGQNNSQTGKYKEAYARLGDLQKRYNPHSVISTGYGYTSYDNNLSPGDGNGQNISPQLTYLKSLDASELWRRSWPDKDQVYFSWPFQETEFVSFPPNHVVEIPEHNARARRTDNKPMYPPTQWEDNMTLGLLTSKYLFYWCPGPVGWNPSGTAQYNNAYTEAGGFSVWTFEQGRAPQGDKFYIGKEAMAINATIKAAYTYSLIQDAMDGSRRAPKFTYKRATKDGSVLSAVTVDEITNGSWYIDALQKRQPFALVCENNGQKVLLVQDVWSRPGRWTEFEVEIEGKMYSGKTEGNRLFIAKL